MDLLALTLVLIGSILHIAWNVLTKEAKDKLAFIWLSLLPPAIVGIVLCVLELSKPIDNWTPWVCLLISGLTHTFYFWALTSAYRFADLSFVYPYCRGIGALLATILGLVFLKERPSLIGGIGISLAILSTLMEPLLSRNLRSLSTKGLIFTFTTGLGIALYLFIDKIGVTYMPHYTYLGMLFIIVAVAFAPAMLKDGRVLKELASSRYKPFMASIFMTSGYGVVLAAMSLSPVSYVVSARATGIVISGVAGVIFFKEDVSRIRWASIVIIAVGIILIGLG
jgi:multidrug transporter EmrE-like cation transporter